MPHDPRLGARVADGAFGAVGRVARSEEAGVVPQDSGAPGLVEGDPVFDAGAHGLENDAGIAREVGDEFGLVEQAAVPVVQRGGQIPMEQRDHRGDARGEQVVGELDVVVEAFLVDGVVAAAKGYDARPVVAG